MINKQKTNIKKLQPFVKWAGGKRHLLKTINLLLPTSYNRLIEPFVGGGAVFLNFQPQESIINDLNKELIITYQTIKENPKKLIKSLTKHEKNNDKELFNNLKREKVEKLSRLDTATRFIYLNKTSYNGLYRVNNRGEFNVPWGQKEKVKLFDNENILNISEYLNKNKVQILNQDYQQILPLIKKDDFMFVDPPYDSEKSNGFTSYTTKKFKRENQKELFNFLKKCEKKGAKWLITNHATSFIKELYKNYWQITKIVNRNINRLGNERKNGAEEILIWNYKLPIETIEQLKEQSEIKFLLKTQVKNIKNS